MRENIDVAGDMSMMLICSTVFSLLLIIKYILKYLCCIREGDFPLTLAPLPQRLFVFNCLHAIST